MVSTVNRNEVDTNKKLSELLAKAVVCLKLREMLTKYGISPEDKVKLSLAVEDKEPVSIILMKGNKNLDVEPTNKSLSDALIDDFLFPADPLFNLVNSFIEAYGIEVPERSEVSTASEQSAIPFTLTVEVNDEVNRLKSRTSAVQYCVPCPPYFPYPWC